MLRTLLRLSGVCLLFSLLTFLSNPPVQAATGNMLSSNHALEACITIAGPPATLPAIQPQACPGLPQQQWQIDANGQAARQ